MFKKYFTGAFWIIVTLIPLVGVIISIFFPNLFFAEQGLVRDFINQYGKAGIIIFITIQVLQAIFAPLSHYTTSVMGGFLFGPLWGGVFNWIGRVIGELIAYSLAITIGRSIVEKFVDKSALDKFEHIVDGDEKTFWARALALFLMIFLPFFPDDELSYLAGLAKFPYKYFIAITMLGHLGGSFALAYAGSGINTRDPYFWIITVITFVFFTILMYTLLKLRKQSK